MTAAEIHFVVTGLDGMIDAMDALMRPPSFRTTAQLEAALLKGFGITQGDVHRTTGKLADSGYTESDLDRMTWTGSINYGGVSGTPAYYAIYELERPGTRPDGTPHDFFSGLGAIEQDFEDAIDTFFEPLKGHA